MVMMTKFDSVQYLPVGLFGSTVAMADLSIAWKAGAVTFGLPAVISAAIGILTAAMFVLLLSLYILKLIRYHEVAKEELMDPVTEHFTGTLFISAVLLAVVAVPFSLAVARILWCCGTVGGIAFIYVLMGRLYKGRLDPKSAVPPVLIPGLTVLNAANAVRAMQFGIWGSEINGILFSFGIAYVLLFFVIITHRLIYGDVLALFLEPTLLLMSAPFAVSFLAYVSPGDPVNSFASVFFFFGLLLLVVLFFNVFKKGLPFMISWWASCFSMGALTNAAIRYANQRHNLLLCDVAAVLLTASTLLIAVTFVLTIRWQLSGRLLNPG
jgi:tellurite resistance protein